MAAVVLVASVVEVLAVAVPEGAGEDAGDLLQALLREHGGRGGGTARLARGRVAAAALPEVLSAWREGRGIGKAPSRQGEESR